jgi:hypothetical protein
MGRGSSRKGVQPALAKAERPDRSLISICALLPSSMDTLHAQVKD